MQLDIYGRCTVCGRNPQTEVCRQKIHEAHARYWARDLPPSVKGAITKMQNERTLAERRLEEKIAARKDSQ